MEESRGRSKEAQRRARARYEEREREQRSKRKHVVLMEKTFLQWNEAKERGGFDTSDELAESLLAMFLTQTPVKSAESAHGTRDMEMLPVTASTPLYRMKDIHLHSSTAVSPPSENGSSPTVSGIHSLQEECATVELEEQTLVNQGFDVNISYSHVATSEWFDEEEEEDEYETAYEGDSDFEPESEFQPEITFHEGPLPKDIDVIGAEEEVIGELPPQQLDEPCEAFTRSGLHAKVAPTQAAETNFCIVSLSRLKSLCKEVRSSCKCREDLDVELTPSGTSVHVKWVCSNGHVTSWCGQETLQRSHVGDMKLASAIVMTGNNFNKVSLLARFMSLNMISSSTFYAHQRKYIAPTIEKKWEEVQATVLSKHKEGRIVLCGDGRNDSPGFCARYLTYILMAHDTKDVVDVQVVEKRETGGKSPLMELEGLKRGLNKLEQEGVQVDELVTDAHPSITRYMREKRPTIRHSGDVWHAGKNLGKKLTKAAGKVSTCALLYWVRHVVFHFWWCAETCGRSSRAFLAKWRGLTHHVTDKHEWVSGLGEGTVTCSHEELPEREEWLQAGSPPHRALVELCYEKRFLSNIERYVTFRHTSTIESLNNHILMYASKRYSFGYRAFRARNFMAVIDYQAHKDRPYKKDANGEKRHQIRWSKHARQYVAVGVKEAKTYPYLREMMEEIFIMRANDPLPLSSPIEMLETDPRRIRPRLETAMPLPNVQEILERRRSRFAV
ncbi:uncharacterized protein LOC121429788 [Lytechinus variegatus]|uniref:uncharacterized protein LOC121429788 n=1 Tax=Lytechinus variegatus TaxID=7654 RepID=UPI001BB2D027|nr:uncharacterized protein LOC121429788 [Lytechinus variegatus]